MIPIVRDPVFTRIDNDRRIRLSNFQLLKPKAHFGDLSKEVVSEVLDRCRFVKLLEFEGLPRTLHVVGERRVEGVVNVDQHPMIVELFDVGLDLGIEVAEERRERTRPLHFKMTTKTVTMAMQIAAFVLKLLVPMSGVELVIFLDDHIERK